MTEKITEAITLLALKFGTTAEHLWRVLTKQAIVTAIGDILIAVLCIVTFLIIFKSLKYIKKEVEDPDNCADMDDYTGVFISLSLVTGIAMLVFGYCISSIITCLLNPEYYALNKVLELLN